MTRSQPRTSQAEMAEFPDMNPGPVLRLDRTGTVLRTNAAARAAFQRDDLGGRCWLDLCPGMTRERWAEVCEGPSGYRLEAVVHGRCLQLVHATRPGSDLVFIFGSDVTELKEAQARVAEQAKALADMARFPDMNPGPVLRLDYAGTVLLANVAAREVLGDDLLGRCWRDLCPGLDVATWQSILGSADMVPFEATLGERDFVFQHRHDPSGELVFVYGADVTREHQAERALRQAEKLATLGTLAAGVAHELNNPAAATRRAAEQLREALVRRDATRDAVQAAVSAPEARERLAALEVAARERAGRRDSLGATERADREAVMEEWLAAHGVNDAWELAPSLVAQECERRALEDLGLEGTPLRAACAWIAAVFGVAELLHDVGSCSARVSEIVQALKRYTYLGQGPVQAIDLHEGLDDTLVMLGNKLEGGVTVRRDYCSDLSPVPAHGSELNLVWTSLLDNAIAAMQHAGTITIRTRRRGATAVVEIEDDGPGIPGDVVARVFDPFFTTKAPGRGTGMGLATSHSTITRHGGTLTVASRPGHTIFTVTLPLEVSPR